MLTPQNESSGHTSVNARTKSIHTVIDLLMDDRLERCHRLKKGEGAGRTGVHNFTWPIYHETNISLGANSTLIKYVHRLQLFYYLRQYC